MTQSTDEVTKARRQSPCTGISSLLYFGAAFCLGSCFSNPPPIQDVRVCVHVVFCCAIMLPSEWIQLISQLTQAHSHKVSQLRLKNWWERRSGNPPTYMKREWESYQHCSHDCWLRSKLEQKYTVNVLNFWAYLRCVCPANRLRRRCLTCKKRRISHGYRCIACKKKINHVKFHSSFKFNYYWS